MMRGPVRRSGCEAHLYLIGKVTRADDNGPAHPTEGAPMTPAEHLWLPDGVALDHNRRPAGG